MLCPFGLQIQIVNANAEFEQDFYLVQWLNIISYGMVQHTVWTFNEGITNRTLSQIDPRTIGQSK